MGHILISAAHKSSGKTTISIGLCAALTQRGLKVQSYKKGPDYIDPMWLGKASARACHNLDFYTQSHDEIVQAFEYYGNDADVRLIEGNKGLYDGLDLDGSNSNAALAELLNAPVVLVIDAQGMTRGIAPLILGYQDFDPSITIAGVILNKLGGSRHESKLRAVIEHYTDVPVIGAVHRDRRLQLLERHLGLIPSNEFGSAAQHIQSVAECVAEQVDLEKLLYIAATAKSPRSRLIKIPPTAAAEVRIGIARDAAFGFYYPGDLLAFEQAGAELVAFDTLRDKHLPPVDGLFIGGGFPETHCEALQANSSIKQEIKAAIEGDMPVYAECGGLMYLTRSIQWQGKTYDMVGAIAADTVMHERPQGRGYVRMLTTEKHPWRPYLQSAAEFPAHEFHYSKLENVDKSLAYAYEVKRGAGIDGKNDGIVYKNTLACYAHLRQVQNKRWVNEFVQFVRSHKTNGNKMTNAL
jgi:cobyrinic acid a,c-diamide synthase